MVIDGVKIASCYDMKTRSNHGNNLNHSSLRKRLSCLLLAATALASVCAPSFASTTTPDDDALVEGAKLCTRYLPRHEREYGIPVHLLAAIASTESGRFHKGLGLTLPWPWTINVEGKGYFFDSKQEAIEAVQKFQKAGYQSIDVGCMQVNLKHHPDAFSSLNEAFDPRYNVAYAAHFLRANYDDLGNWRSAAAAYHSRTPEYGNSYVYNVYTRWNQILTKIAQARGGVKATGVELASVEVADAPLSRSALTSTLKEKGYERSTKEVSRSVASNSASKQYARKPVRMRVIELAKSERSKENGVIVIRPKSQEQEYAAAETAPLNALPAGEKALPEVTAQTDPKTLAAAEPAAGQFNPRSKLIRIDRGGKVTDKSNAAAQQFSPRKAAQFVFDN